MTTTTIDPFKTKSISTVLENPQIFLTDKKLALLEDTVNYYNEDKNRRSFKPRPDSDYIICLYRSEDNKRACAIGRFITDQTLALIAAEDLLEIGYKGLAEHGLLPKIFNQFSLEYISNLQYIHDNSKFWYKRGLSLAGQTYVEKLKEKIKTGKI